MTSLNRARSAYARADAPARPARSLEYELFAQITGRLSAAWARRSNDHPALVSALYDNSALWRTLAIDVADPENGLPKMLRARLFYLHEFAVQHTAKVLEGLASAEVLVDINTAVMRGLRGNGEAA